MPWSNAISVKKDLAGREWKTYRPRSISRLAAKGNAPLPDKLRSRSAALYGEGEASDSGSHTASFGNITYNAGDASYTYYVTEVNAARSLHCTIRRREYEVVVTVAKDDPTERGRLP